jgi:hypothetical protein
LSGQAKNGRDYARLPNSVTIPTGSAAAYVEINPIDDRAKEPAEKVTLTLLKNSNAQSGGYKGGKKVSATAVIVDDDKK